MENVSEPHIDIEFLKTHNLMSDVMIQGLIKKRILFNQKSSAENITRDDYLKQIKVESYVMELCDLGNHTTGVPITSNINGWRKFKILMSNRIDHLYFSMFQMFSIGCVLLVEYMEFQRNNESFITNEMSPIMLLMSIKKCEPQMFIAAGTFEYGKQNIEKARQYFVEGIKIHKHEKSLYVGQLWIEVMHLSDLGGGESNETIVIQIYKNIIENFNHDMDFHILLLNRCIEVRPIIWRLQKEIICDLMEKYKQSDYMWNKVAILCTKGFIFDHDFSFFGYSTDFEDRARCCIETYHKGILNTPTNTKKRNLMILLTENIIKFWKINKNTNDRNINILLKREMKRAFQIFHFDLGGIHEPEFYVYWAIISQDYRPAILKLAVDLNKDNPEVWAEVLDYHIMHNSSSNKIQMIFELGYQALENNSLQLWEIMNSFLQQYCDITMLGEFYEKGAYSPYEEINTVYKVNYITWSSLYYGISSSRNVFNQLINLEPDNKNLYVAMIQCEKQQPRIDVNIIKKLYNNACIKCCQIDNDASLWAEYIEFELTHFGSYRAQNTYYAALNIVNPQLRDDLRRKYQSITDAHSRRMINTHSDTITDCY